MAKEKTTKEIKVKEIKASSTKTKSTSTEVKKMKFTPEVGVEELLTQYNEHVEKLAEHRMMLTAGQLQQTHIIRQLRKNIARIKQAMAMIV